MIEALRASVRPLAALAVTFTFCYLALVGRLPTDAFMGVVGSVTTFYFLSRSMERRP